MNDIPEWFEESARRNRERIDDFLKREKEERIQKLRDEITRLPAEVDRLELDLTQSILPKPEYVCLCRCIVKE